jgi:predicted dehydrogenase
LDNPTKQENENTHSGSATASVEDTTNHEYVIKDFIEAIREKKEPLVSGDSARNATEIILDIYNNQF